MIHKGNSENANGVYLGSKEIKKVFFGNEQVWGDTPIPDPPSPGFEWDETKIGLLVLDENNEPVQPIRVSYHDTWADALDAIDYHDWGHWLHQGRLMNPIPELAEGQFDSYQTIVFVDLYNQTCIPDYCFNNYDYGGYLSRITGVSSITSIGESAFRFCYFLDISIPGTVTYIGESAFEATSISNAIIPNGITEIKDDTFNGCEHLINVSIPDSVTALGKKCLAASSLTTLTLPDSLLTIDKGAFNYTHISSITFPRNLVSINFPIFDYCVDLININSDGRNANYTSDDGVLYNSDGRTLVSYPTGRQTMSISNNTEAIGDYAFSTWTGTSGVIPENVVSIGKYAFQGSSLTSITFSQGLTSIGVGAFNDCSGLIGQLTIPSSVQSIGRDAFPHNSELTSIIINKPEGSISGAPWGAFWATVTWTG